MGIFDEHTSGLALHAPDAPRSISQQHDVAGVTLNCEIFIERADNNALWLSDHCEQGSLRDCSPTGDRRQTRSSPCSQFVMHTIVMDVSAITSAAGRNAL